MAPRLNLAFLRGICKLVYLLTLNWYEKIYEERRFKIEINNS